MISIRPLEAADIEAVLTLEVESQPQPWTEGIFNDELTAENRTYVVAEDAAILGFGGVMVIGDEAHITNLLVAPDRRGEGIGRKIMLELMEAAVAEGAKHMTLEVRSQNVPGRALYGSLGFAPVGMRPGYYQDDDALILWLHDLDQASVFDGGVEFASGERRNLDELTGSSP